jgi:hypothetical protein
MRDTCTWPWPQSGEWLSSALEEVLRTALGSVKREM